MTLRGGGLCEFRLRDRQSRVDSETETPVGSFDKFLCSVGVVRG